jgi:fructan beta-fructosidase
MIRPFVLVAAVIAAVSVAQAQREPFRPQFHFTPQQNWMNDPNGMVFYDGEWHLFYQYNPFGDKWGHMSWGHAVSRDLVRWEHLPVALAEEDGVMIFSGSAVVDWKNTSGFGVNGKPPMIAVYTGHRQGRQDQRIAYSNDRGRTWTKAPGGPVLDLQMADFRDPKVFWHAPTSRWVMVVALPNEHLVQFYASPNLRQWSKAGAFGPAGATGGQWECPDLFPVNIEGGGTRWVLIVNINPGGPTGGSGTQYFTGTFDGARFTADASGTRWADHGADFYAGVSWGDVPPRDGRRVWLGWMSNWLYAQNVPTSPWRSAMTVPRALTLRRTPAGLRLVQTPVRELESLRAGPPRRFGGGSLSAANAWLAAQPDLPPLLDIELAFADVRQASTFSIQIATGSNERSTVAIDADRQQLVVDRAQSGQTAFDPKFSLRHMAPLRIVNGEVRVRLLLDSSSLEVFAQRGETVLTDLIFPGAGSRRLALDAVGEAPRVREITINLLESASGTHDAVFRR